MKYCLTFQCSAPTSVPIHYNKILQAALLSWMGFDGTLASSTGEEKRYYQKWYTFSEILGNRDCLPMKNKYVYYGQIQIVLSFPQTDTHDAIVKAAECRRPLRLGWEYVEFKGCSIIEEEVGEEILIETLSPLSVYELFEKEDGRKSAYYYSPFDEGFSSLIREDLLGKHIELYGKEPEDTRFEIQLVSADKLSQATVWYNNFFVRGWHGQFVIKGSKELLTLALHVGLGERNNIGMGCIVRV